jgi:hypothetical protein
VCATVLSHVLGLHAEHARGLVIAGRLHIFVQGRKPA